MEVIRISTEHLEKHGLVDHLQTVADIDKIDQLLFEPDQDVAGSD